MFSFSSLFAIAIAIASTLLAYSIFRLFREVPVEDRQYMDPLPWTFKVIWPLINLLAQHIGEYLTVDYLERQKVVLRRSELMYLLTPEQFFGLRLLTSIICLLLTYLGFSLSDANPGLVPLFLALFGFMLPAIKLTDRRKRREKQLIKELPVFLDYLTMAVQSGLNFSGAIIQAVDKGPEGPLKKEFQLVLRDIRAGKSRLEAFRVMESRTNIKEIKSFVNAIAQAERTGSSLSDVLQIQADQRRTERFQRAEKLALEAPVKLLFPLVVFIFPTTFLILGFPILMKFLHDL